ncbi:hypothetical protein Barb4_02266 [Bacteroidales bacterium Barb4]|nr:hypothetical protein Barb4_02266 [Bacteroidales bacterium Barb4]
MVHVAISATQGNTTYKGVKTLDFTVTPPELIDIDVFIPDSKFAGITIDGTEGTNLAALKDAVAAVVGSIDGLTSADYEVGDAVLNGNAVRVTINAKGRKFTGNKTIEFIVTVQKTVDGKEDLKGDLSSTVVTVSIPNDTIPKGFFADVKGKVFEIVLPSTIKKIEEGAFPPAKNIEKGIDIRALGGQTVSVDRKAFSGQKLIVSEGTELKFSNIGEGSFQDAVFTDSATIVLDETVNHEIPANAFANAKGVKIDFSNGAKITGVKASAFAGFDTKAIKGLFKSSNNGGGGLFDVKLSNLSPFLKAADNNDAEDTEGNREILTLTDTYANKALEIHFTVKNAVNKLLENPKDYTITAKTDKGSADLKNLINADAYTLGLRINGYEGLNDAFADGRLLFKIEQYDLADASVSLAPGKTFLYTGKVIEPDPKTEFTVKDGLNNTLIFGKDFELLTDEDGDVIAYDNNDASAGSQNIRIVAVTDAKGKFTGNYKNEGKVTFDIAKRPLSQTDIEIANRYSDGKTGVKITSDDVSASINGEACKLLFGDYYFKEAASSSNDYFEVEGAYGEKTATLVAKEGNFTGEAKVKFTLVGNDIREAVLSEIGEREYTYSGLPVNPLKDETLNIREGLQLDKDYKVVYSTSDRTNVSKEDIIVSVRGIGKWGETAPVGTFSIVPADFNSNSLEIIVPNYTLKKDEEPNAALKSIEKTVVVKLNGVELPVKDFDITASLITNRNQAAIEVKPADSNDNFTDGVRSKTINILAYTANEAVAAANASVSYANGVLTLTNLNGTTATIVSLNGKLAAKFTVSGSEVQKDVTLAPGFYILSAGKTVSKFIVR